MRRGRYIRGALQAGALFISLLLAAASGAPLADAETATVRAALDGDSLRLGDGREVRLIGINAPEIGKNGTPDQPLARAARDRASALARGRTVRLIYDEQRLDRYGRTLAYVVLPDGRDLDELLLAEGFGWYIAIPPNVAHLDAYRAAEARARLAGRGIWSRPEYDPLPAERVTREHYGFIRLAGTVSAVDPHATGIEVALGPNVHLWIPKEIYRSLPVALRRGTRVLARGWLAEYKGRARMRITHAAMLEEVSP